MGEGVLYNAVFTEFPFKTVSGDVTAFHRIAIVINITPDVEEALLLGSIVDVGPTLYQHCLDKPLTV